MGDSDTRRRPSRSYIAAVILLLVIAGGVRFYALDAKSLWMDELRQVGYYKSRNLAQVAARAATQQQPPLDYWIGYGLHRVGLDDSDWWVRFPAAFFGVLGVLAIVVLGSRTGGAEVGLLAGSVAALSPLHISMSQEARPYTIFAFLVGATLIFFIEARIRNRISTWLLFGLFLYLSLMTRAFAPVLGRNPIRAYLGDSLHL